MTKKIFLSLIITIITMFMVSCFHQPDFVYIIEGDFHSYDFQPASFGEDRTVTNITMSFESISKEECDLLESNKIVDNILMNGHYQYFEIRVILTINGEEALLELKDQMRWSNRGNSYHFSSIYMGLKLECVFALINYIHYDADVPVKKIELGITAGNREIYIFTILS